MLIITEGALEIPPLLIQTGKKFITFRAQGIRLDHFFQGANRFVSPAGLQKALSKFIADFGVTLAEFEGLQISGDGVRDFANLDVIVTHFRENIDILFRQRNRLLQVRFDRGRMISLERALFVGIEANTEIGQSEPGRRVLTLQFLRPLENGLRILLAI